MESFESFLNWLGDKAVLSEQTRKVLKEFSTPARWNPHRTRLADSFEKMKARNCSACDKEAGEHCDEEQRQPLFFSAPYEGIVEGVIKRGDAPKIPEAAVMARILFQHQKEIFRVNEDGEPGHGSDMTPVLKNMNFLNEHGELKPVFPRKKDFKIDDLNDLNKDGQLLSELDEDFKNGNKHRQRLMRDPYCCRHRLDISVPRRLPDIIQEHLCPLVSREKRGKPGKNNTEKYLSSPTVEPPIFLQNLFADLVRREAILIQHDGRKRLERAAAMASTNPRSRLLWEHLTLNESIQTTAIDRPRENGESFVEVPLLTFQRNEKGSSEPRFKRKNPRTAAGPSLRSTGANGRGNGTGPRRPGTSVNHSKASCPSCLQMLRWANCWTCCA